MIHPAPDERVIARRPQGAKPVLAGIVATGGVALLIYCLATWALLGTVPLRGVVLFVLTFTAINAAAHVLIRRRIDYCLTDQRLLLAPDRSIPLDDIQRFQVGPHSLTVETQGQRHRIIALRSPAWLATRLNRCRASAAPETGKVAA